MTGRLRTDLGLVAVFLRNSGGARATMIALCTALVSGLLLVALSVVLFALAPRGDQARVSNLIADGGVRGGYLSALVLICVAPLALLRQVVRLGTASREHRLAALRLAGATSSDVRRWGAVEVGLPALVGGLLGYPVFAMLRAVFGGTTGLAVEWAFARPEVARELQLVPTTVHPGWWQVMVVALVVALLGVLAGATTSRSLVISPLGVSRRAPRSAPQPWAVLLLVLAPVLFAMGADSSSEAGGLFVLASGVSLVAGLLLLAPWVAQVVGTVVARRATTVSVLLAGRRLAVDARPAGRAAAAIGAIALVAGGGGVLLADLATTQGNNGFASVDPSFTVPLALVGLVLLAALLLVVFSMAVHGVESLVDHKRSAASLAVLGASTAELARAQRWEVGLVAIPMAVIGVLAGTLPLAVLLDGAIQYAWVPMLVDSVTIGLVWMAVGVSTRMTRPWLIRATAPVNLRTP